MEFRLLEGLRGIGRPPSGPPPLTDGVAEVRAYWEGLRPGGGIPARSDLDPRGMSGALGRVFIAERIGSGIALVRIAGSALSEIAGLDLRGLPLTCLFQPEARPSITLQAERVFSIPVAADLVLEAERGTGRPALTARLILLPLRDLEGRSSLMLGCLAIDGGLSRSPRRFAIHRMTEERLLAPGGAPAVRRIEPDRPAGQHRRAHLRLVHSSG